MTNVKPVLMAINSSQKGKVAIVIPSNSCYVGERDLKRLTQRSVRRLIDDGIV